jgi:hypothetical protein
MEESKPTEPIFVRPGDPPPIPYVDAIPFLTRENPLPRASPRRKSALTEFDSEFLMARQEAEVCRLLEL